MTEEMNSKGILYDGVYINPQLPIYFALLSETGLYQIQSYKHAIWIPLLTWKYRYNLLAILPMKHVVLWWLHFISIVTRQQIVLYPLYALKSPVYSFFFNVSEECLADYLINMYTLRFLTTPPYTLSLNRRCWIWWIYRYM